jgi:hypothetical protein
MRRKKERRRYDMNQQASQNKYASSSTSFTMKYPYEKSLRVERADLHV